MSEQPQTTAGHTMDIGTRVRIVRELHDIAALDRRVPQVQRVGEVAIAKAAAWLKAALKRIDALEGEACAVRLSNGQVTVTR